MLLKWIAINDYQPDTSISARGLPRELMDVKADNH